MDLSKKKCIACEDKSIKPFSKSKAKEFAAEVPGWELSRDSKKISKEFTFRDFKRAMRFINQVARIAEAEDHHPDIYIFYNKVAFDLWTHAIKGLSENDFIIAAKIDKLKAMDLP